jgi:tetratricopeptide (TPR) repeat protein
MTRIATLAMALVVAFGTAASAAPEPPRGKKPEASVPPRAATLDELFDRLRITKDESEAKGITAVIQRRWMRSGSDTSDLLMGRAIEALEAKDEALAVELLDRVISLQPDWAEAWNKRATVFFMMGDRTRSMADIRETLLREPRHFGALAGLGAILQANGDQKAAFEVFGRALTINPFLPEVKQVYERLKSEYGDRDI